MCERVKSFAKFLKTGGLYPCNIFTNLIFECPEQLLACIQSVDDNISLGDRKLCNCYAQVQIDCDCLPMPLLNHFVYIISSFPKHFDLAKQIIDAFIQRGCHLNQIDADIGTVLHSVICCIDNDIRMNATEEEYNLSLECLDYLLSLNKCDLNIDVGSAKFCKAKGTPLALAVERELLDVVKRLISVGVSLPKSTINQSYIPETISDKLVQIYDLLFTAGYDFDDDFKTVPVDFIPNQNKMKYSDWFKSKKRQPITLKCLSRIVIRNILKTRINDDNLSNFISIPRSLILYLRFQTN